MRFTVLAGVCVAVLLTTSVAAKGVTTRITITDPAVVQQFNVWAGPGTAMTVGGIRTEGLDGFIVDWPAGAVEQRPDGLPRYEVKFHARLHRATEDKLVYVVLFERGAAEGFVYLPGRSDQHWGLNVGSILRGRGYEGHWFRASAAWQAAVSRVLAR